MKVKSYNTTKELLLSTPLPLQTRTYKPIHNRQLVDLTLEGIHQAGFELERERYLSAKDGNVGQARYDIKSVADNEMQLSILWTNSYDKSLKLDFQIGATVLVCTNGMVSFRRINSLKKKHMGEIQTFAPNMIGEYIKQAGEVFSSLQVDRDSMKQVHVDKRLTSHLIGQMYLEEDFLESTQLNIIKRELLLPTHDYNAPESLWELYNFTTYAIGGIHPEKWIENHQKAHKFFMDAMEIYKSYSKEEEFIDFELML